MSRDAEKLTADRELTSAPEAVGSALLVTMLIAVLVSGLAAVLVVVLSTEEAIEANHRRGVVELSAADGVLTEVVADPGRDTNGRVVVRAVVFGPFRTRRAVEAAIGREWGAVGPVRIVAWGLVR